MDKTAITQEPIHELLQQRWSPRAFTGVGIDDATLVKILEAGRWAASAFNDQPWRYIVAKRQDEAEFGRMASCLGGFNQKWAPNADVLIAVTAFEKRNDDGTVQPMNWYNVGLSVSQMVMEATNNGLHCHQMAGIDRPKVVAEYGVPSEYAPICIMAIGHVGSADDLPEPLNEREGAVRERLALGDIAFSGKWDNAVSL